MNRSPFRIFNPSPIRVNLTLCAGVAVFLLIASPLGIAQEVTSTLSGRVVDVDGNPIAGFPIAVGPLLSIDGVIRPMFLLGGLLTTTHAPWLESQTDGTGRFSIAGIKPGPIQFLAKPNPLKDDDLPPHDFDQDDFMDAEVLSIDIEVMTFYRLNQERPPYGGITFSIEPGAHLDNVEVTVRPRMRIRAQIVFSDGTPLANAEVQIDVRRRDFNGSGFGSRGGAPRTDDTGYFVHYVDDPAIYTVAVEFQGLTATSERFALEDGQRRENLVITFDSEPVAVDPTPDREEPEREGEWVVNPANGHSYKSIHCERREDAQSKAMREGAHLVSINDAAEQKWLVSIFGSIPYWIGLTDGEKEGEWSWMNGEPVSYTNWAPNEPTDADWGEEDYVFMGLTPDGKWYDVGPGSPMWRMTQMAIIEKGGLPPKPPVREK